MTKTEIALLAIKSVEISNRSAHIDINSIMRGLNLSTQEASELRRMVGAAWLAATGDQAEILDLAKEVTNTYATNYSVR